MFDISKGAYFCKTFYKTICLFSIKNWLVTVAKKVQYKHVNNDNNNDNNKIFATCFHLNTQIL